MLLLLGPAPTRRKKQGQKQINERMAKSKTFKENNSEKRAERVKGARVSTRAESATQVESKKGAFRSNFDKVTSTSWTATLT